MRLFLLLYFAFLGELGAERKESWLGFYNGRKSAEGAYGIGVAGAPAVIGPWKVRSSPLITAPTGYVHVSKPAVVKVGEKFRMYAQANRVGADGAMLSDLFSYFSDDGLVWSLSAAHPVLEGASRPEVLYEPFDKGKEFKLWYRAQGANDTSYAYSSDGVHWVRFGTVLKNGPPGSFDSRNLSPGAIIKHQGLYYLFYEAADDGIFFNGGVATFTNPEGVYTKNPLNPILRRESEASASLTRSANAGDKELFIVDSSVFKLGQPLVLFDTRARWELVRVAGVVGPRNLRLQAPLAQSYDVQKGATVRSWAFAKVYVSDVFFEGGLWNIVATAFDPYEGITDGPLEMTGFATGVTLEGLKWDYERSPLLPATSSLDTSWDAESRENLSIVAQ